MARLTPTDVLNWFREVDPAAGQQMLELAQDALRNRSVEPKQQRRPRGPNKPKSSDATQPGAGAAA